MSDDTDCDVLIKNVGKLQNKKNMISKNGHKYIKLFIDLKVIHDYKGYSDSINVGEVVEYYYITKDNDYHVLKGIFIHGYKQYFITCINTGDIILNPYA